MMKPRYQIALLDTKKNNANYYIVKQVLRALQAHPAVAGVSLCTYDTLVPTVAGSAHDILVCIDGEQMNLPIVLSASRYVDRTALWVWEDPYERSVNVANAAHFDIVFTNDLGSLAAYGGRARFLPLAAATEIPVAPSLSHARYDLFFAGSAWPNRVKFLRQVQQRLPHIRTKIVLQYNPGVPPAGLDAAESDYVGSISNDEFLHLANASKVTLTLHRAFSGDGKGRAATTPGPRLFEIALAGGCQLIDAHGVEIERFLRPGRDVECFDGFPDFAAKLTRLLDDPARRHALATASQARTRAEHSYAARVDEMLRALDEVPVRPRTPPVVGTSPHRPKLLLVAHNSVITGAFGGVEVYQNVLAAELRKHYDVTIFLPAHPPIRGDMREYLLTDSHSNVRRTFLVPDFDMWTTLSHPPLEEVFGRILFEEGIELVHFQHLINLSASLPIIARMLGMPTVFTFHDFWTVCKKFNLVDYTGRYCHVAERPRVACDICLKASDDLHEGAQSYRREFFAKVLSSFTTIVFNTPYSKHLAETIYPELRSGDHPLLGVPVPRVLARRSGEAGDGSGTQAGARRTLRVAFFGNFTVTKGAEVFLEAVSVLQQDSIAFTICGHVDDEYRSRIAAGSYDNVTVEGRFAPGEIDLTRFDVALILSIWPETYCITLSETWQAGVVPVASDCGALADRIEHGVNGYTLPVGDTARLVEHLRRLTHTPELDRIRSNITPALWLTPAQHVETLDGIYRAALATAPARAAAPNAPDRVVGPTLEISDLGVLPRRWTDKTAGPPIPRYGRETQAVSPLWRQARVIRQAFAEGRVEPGGLEWNLDAFTGFAADPDDWMRLPPAPVGHGPHLRGWFAATDGDLHTVDLGLRSPSGEVALIPLDVHDRLDVVQHKRSMARGFDTLAMTADGLPTGTYGVELYRTRTSGRIEVATLPLVVHVDAATTASRTSPATSSTGAPWTIPRVPVPDPAPRSAPIRSSLGLHYFVDDFQVRNHAPPGGRPVFSLRARGWIVCRNGSDIGGLALRLSGRTAYTAPLASVSRADVAHALGGDVSHECGFDGTAWLAGLPDDRYEVCLVLRHMETMRELYVGTLIVGAGNVEIGDLSLGGAAT